MPRRWQALFVAPALLFTLVLTSCESAIGPAPETRGEPEVVTSPVSATVTATDGDQYEPIEETLPSDIDDLVLSKVIDPDGGTISLAGHSITIPEGALDQPTLITLTLVTNGYVEVDLAAEVELLDGTVVNLFDDEAAELLGLQTEFHEPVTLSLTYARGTNVDDPQDLTLLRMLGDSHDDPHEALPSGTDGDGKVVTAELDHFSGYCMAQ